MRFQNFPEDLAPGFGPYAAVVDRIVDGDTLYVEVSVGFDTYLYRSIRLAGVDAPEIFSGTLEERERGHASRRYLEALCPPGTPCRLFTDRDRTTFSRYVGCLHLAGGRIVNEVMNAHLGGSVDG